MLKYKKQQDNKKPKNAWGIFIKVISALGNQEAMMSPAVGGLDWLN